jgi:hypothetical protein
MVRPRTVQAQLQGGHSRFLDFTAFPEPRLVFAALSAAMLEEARFLGAERP